MKNYLKIIASLAILGSTILTSSAATLIGVNFNGWQGDFPVTGSAGVEAQTNWNNTPYAGGGENGSLTDLVDNTGSATSTDLTWTGAGQNSNGISNTGGNDSLMKGMILANGSSTISVTNLSSDFTLNGYYVIVYTGSDADGRTTTLSVTSSGYTTPTYSLTSNAYSGTFTQATTNGGTDAANYAVFGSDTTPLTSSSFTINYSSGYYSGVTGFQIVAVPEPSTYAMLAVGLGCLMLLRQRAKKTVVS